MMVDRPHEVCEGCCPCQEPDSKASCQNLSASQLVFIPRAFSGMCWYLLKRLRSLRAHVEYGLMVNKID